MVWSRPQRIKQGIEPCALPIRFYDLGALHPGNHLCSKRFSKRICKTTSDGPVIVEYCTGGCLVIIRIIRVERCSYSQAKNIVNDSSRLPPG